MQFRNTATHSHHACSQTAKSEKICHTCHKSLVKCGHDLHDAVARHTSAGKGTGFVESQSFEIAIGASEGYCLAHRTRGGDIVDDLAWGYAEEVRIVALQICFLREGQLLQVVNGADLCHINVVYSKHPLIERRFFCQIVQVFAQKIFLKFLNDLGRLERNISHKSRRLAISLMLYCFFGGILTRYWRSLGSMKHQRWNKGEVKRGERRRKNLRGGWKRWLRYAPKVCFYRVSLQQFAPH